LRGRWPRSLNLGFPNPYDKALARTGSYILVHGGCSSAGCFAMTNPVMEEIYTLVEKALRSNQEHIPVHVFPFRMTDANLERFSSREWHEFWLNLKQGYDAFEATRMPPQIGVCENRYVVHQVRPGESAAPERLTITFDQSRRMGLGHSRAEGLGAVCQAEPRIVTSAEGRRMKAARAMKRRPRSQAPAREVQGLSDDLWALIFTPR